jgi:dTDP-4-dehydrorhamnose 3,5-epimerase-like enzyme
MSHNTVFYKATTHYSTKSQHIILQSHDALSYKVTTHYSTKSRHVILQSHDTVFYKVTTHYSTKSQHSILQSCPRFAGRVDYEVLMDYIGKYSPLTTGIEDNIQIIQEN